MNPAPSRSQRCSGNSQSLSVAKSHARHLGAEFPVIVDLAVGDEGGRAREQRLIPACDVDDRQARVHERDPADDRVPRPVRSAMPERPGERPKLRGVGRRGARRQ